MAKCRGTIWYCVLWTLFTKAYAAVNTVGYSFESHSALDQNARGVFLMDDVVFPKSVIYNITVYCVRPDRTVWIQVWRPVDHRALTYKLIGQVNLIAAAVPRYYQIILNSQEDMIFTEDGDRLAIYHDKQSSPVGYSFVQSTMTPVYRSTPGNNVTMSIGTELSFLDFMFPYRFSVSATYDTDTDSYLKDETRTIVAPIMLSTTMMTIPPKPEDRDNFTYVGNPLDSRRNVMMTNARGVYILRHIRFSRGVVVSFLGYFVRKYPVWFQVWRPAKDDDVSRYMLVRQVRVVPEFFPQRQEFKLNPDEYIFTEDGDILGILVEADVNPIGFKWIYEQTNRKPLGSRPKEVAPGQIITFASVELPYDFAVGALYDKEPNEDKYGTPPPIAAPTTTTTTTPSTTTTMTNIIRAPSIGQDTIRPTNHFLKNHARMTFLISDTKFPKAAIVYKFYAYFANPGSVEFQVWRKVDASTFILIGRKQYTALSSGYAVVYLNRSEQFFVEANDCLGYYNDDPHVGAIGYHFEATNLFYNDENFDFNIFRSLTFQEMLYPYRFAIAASYAPIIETTLKYRTTRAPENPSDNKDKCPPYCPELSQQLDDKYSWLKDPQLLLGFLIWLILLTVMFIIVCIIVMVMRKRHKKTIIRHRPYSFTNPVTSSFSRYDQMMKGEDFGNFFDVTLHSNGNRDSDSSGNTNGKEKQKTNGRSYTRM